MASGSHQPLEHHGTPEPPLQGQESRCFRCPSARRSPAATGSARCRGRCLTRCLFGDCSAPVIFSR